MDTADRSKIDPALLPSSPRAAVYHRFRVYHQVQVWKQLSNVDKDPLREGCVIENKMFRLMTADNEAGPPDLLKIVRCGCKGPRGKSYFCRKTRLKVTSATKLFFAIKYPLMRN